MAYLPHTHQKSPKEAKVKRNIAVLAILWIAFLLPAYLSANQTEAKTEFPYIGVIYAPITEQTLSRPKVSRTIKKKIKEKLKEGQTGLYLVSVVRRTPAYKAGMRKGDILKQFNGQKIESHQDFIYWISQFKPGQEVTLTIERKDKLIDLPVTLAAKPVSPEFIKALKWIKLDRQLNPDRKMMVVIAGKEAMKPYLVLEKEILKGGTFCQGIGYGVLVGLHRGRKELFGYQTLIHSSHPLIVLFSPDQINGPLGKIPEEYHFLSVIGVEKVTRILDEGKCLIVLKWEKEEEVNIPGPKNESISLVRGERYLTLIAAPNKKLLLEAIARFLSLDKIPLEPIIWKPK